MKIGFVISMYDEIDTVNSTITNIKKNNSPIIVIQSDPNQSEKLVEQDQVDFYQKLPDFAGSKEDYLEERATKIFTTGSRALTRNYSVGFTAAKDFDVDWWVAINGDVSISHLNGIKKLLKKWFKKKKQLELHVL